MRTARTWRSLGSARGSRASCTPSSRAVSQRWSFRPKRPAACSTAIPRERARRWGRGRSPRVNADRERSGVTADTQLDLLPALARLPHKARGPRPCPSGRPRIRNRTRQPQSHHHETAATNTSLTFRDSANQVSHPDGTRSRSQHDATRRGDAPPERTEPPLALPAVCCIPYPSNTGAELSRESPDARPLLLAHDSTAVVRESTQTPAPDKRRQPRGAVRRLLLRGAKRSPASRWPDGSIWCAVPAATDR